MKRHQTPFDSHEKKEKREQTGRKGTCLWKCSECGTVQRSTAHTTAGPEPWAMIYCDNNNCIRETVHNPA